MSPRRVLQPVLPAAFLPAVLSAVLSAPQVQVPNGVGYDVYYYLNDGYYIDENDEEQVKPGWCDAYGTIAGNVAANAEVDGILTPGISAWVKDVGADEAFVQAGQVPADASVVVGAPVAFALRANVFPVAFNLNDTAKVEFSGLTPAVFDDAYSFRATAPQIQVPNGIGYDVYYYLEDGYYIDENGEELVKPGWCDAYGTIAGNVAANAEVSGDVIAGQGFWTKGVGSAFTMTFKK